MTTDYVFGPGTVGSSPAEHKPFLAAASGGSVSVALEDMARQPGCEYDYNDRTWGGVTAATTANPVLFGGTSSGPA